MAVAVAMEVFEELAPAPAAPMTDASVVAKGKRTKRQRPHSPIPFAAIVSPMLYTSTTEEVNTARSLILLSQGHFANDDISRRCDQAAATTSYGGTCVYTCKTCGRSFASFQALGGHRASHKKPKNEKRMANIFADEEDFPSPNSLSLQLSSGSTATFSATMKSPRVHVCSHCGAEFTSGQALGGHMRKHRGAGPIGRALIKIAPEATVVELEPEESKNLGIGLALDLNLPAPVDEKDKSPKTLIDCHY